MREIIRFAVLGINYMLDFILDRDQIIKEIEGMSNDEVYELLSDFPKKNADIDSAKDIGLKYLFNYSDPRIKDLIYQLKYNDGRIVSKIFGEMLHREYISKLPRDIVLVPVPIHKKRLSERGYNQCYWLCEEICRHDPKIKYDPNILNRIVYTEKQSWHNRSERFNQAKNIFKINTKKLNTNSTYVIIDDVYTTGSTMKEIRRMFLSHGALKLIFITVAH
jgi:ComF family protein